MYLSLYHIIVLLIVFTALFAYINHRFIKLPSMIGIMLISLICSIPFVFFGSFLPGINEELFSAVSRIDFDRLLLNGMLGFILFAGAIHVDVHKLKKEAGPVISLATIGVLVSTVIIGSGMFFVFKAFNIQIDIIYCFLFGALISPTDPIAVLSILKKSKIPMTIETRITGESLFNDGVGVVIFIMLIILAKEGFGNLSFIEISWLFIKETGGGLIWGFLLGYAGFYLIKTIDNYQAEILLTLALVMGGYTFANWLTISGPLAMVVAGLITGSKGKKLAMSDVTKDYLEKFWELIDEILNALLFLLIGLELFVIRITQNFIWISLLAIIIMLLARFISILIPIFFLSFQKKRTFDKNTVAVLTWGGLKGGISVALALSLPGEMHRNEFVTITYVIVIFSIAVQGLTLGKVAQKLVA